MVLSLNGKGTIAEERGLGPGETGKLAVLWASELIPGTNRRGYPEYRAGPSQWPVWATSYSWYVISSCPPLLMKEMEDAGLVSFTLHT